MENFYVTSQPQLQRVIELIEEAKCVALDTEFTRETTYYPILSIIQVAVKNSSGEQETFVVDCISGVDLSALFGVIANPKITKILHSSTQDLQIFYHESGLLPSNVMDTQIMANFCGFGFNVGYSSLVEKFFDRHLDKKQQRSDWQRRPLSTQQLEYALLDVVFLEEIYEKFLEILNAENRLNWCHEEMQSFTNKTLFRTDEDLNKKISFRNKNAAQIFCLKKLVLWREDWAKKTNVPRRHFLKDEVLEKIAADASIEGVKSFNFTTEMLAGINEILAEKNEFSNKNSVEKKKFFLSEEQKNRYQETKKLISKIATKENFKEQFLVTNSDLEKMVREQKFFNEKLTGWRQRLFGAELGSLLLS